MRKKIKGILIPLLNNFFVKWALIPMLLLFLWPVLSYFFIPHASLTTITQEIPDAKINDNKDTKLFKNEKITGEFTADYDNLGIIDFHMGLYINNLENTDTLLFKIKERGSSSWYFEAKHDSGFFHMQTFSPFGFPLIADSKGKTYIFEVTSIAGNPSNAITVFDKSPAFIARYDYPNSELINDHNLRYLIFKNFKRIFLSYDFLSSSIVFILPLVFYLSYSIYKSSSNVIGKKFKIRIFENKQSFPILLIFIMLFDIFFITKEIYGLSLGIIVFWIFTTTKLSISSKFSFITSGFILVIASICATSSMFRALDKASVWLFFLFVFASAQLLLEVNSSKSIKN